MRRSHALTLILLTVILAAAPAHSALAADMQGDNGKTIPSATVNIAVSHTWEGDRYSGSDTVKYILTAEEDKCPMPEGSADGVKTVTAGARDSVDFGDIVFEYPDAYFYDITRIYTDTKQITHDTGSFRVLVVKFNTGDTLTVIRDMAAGEKTDAVRFTDHYKAPAAPATGDSLPLTEIAVFAAASVSLTVMLLFLLIKKKKGGDIVEE